MKDTLNKIKNEKGFSLVELLVAITVLAIGLLGVAGLQGSTIRRNVAAMRNTEAVALLEDEIENIRNTPFGNIDSAAGTDLVTDTIFTRTVTVQDGVPIVGSTKTITVQVSWSDSGYHALSFKTVVSN